MTAQFTYRTLNGCSYYTFQLVRQPDRSFRIYILAQPPYGGVPEGGRATRRSWHPHRRLFYIDVPKPPRSLNHALYWAKEWAEATELYRYHYRQNMTDRRVQVRVP